MKDNSFYKMRMLTLLPFSVDSPGNGGLACGAIFGSHSQGSIQDYSSNHSQVYGNYHQGLSLLKR